ncbi:MAG: hypothetical protein H8F28_22460 [Fibrella sp.]|nr:hypothetical protein [Armatimonadota bacterium]
MSQLLLWNFVVPNVVGVIALIGVVWLYILNDYCGWKSFWRHKYRARVFWSARLTLFFYGSAVTAGYGLSTVMGMSPVFGTHVAWGGKLLLLFFIDGFLIALIYRLADALVAKYGKLGPQRPPEGNTNTGIYSTYHAGYGGEHHI